MPDITQISGVGVAAMAVYFMWRLLSNHLTHSTKAIEELRDMIKELKNFLTSRL